MNDHQKLRHEDVGLILKALLEPESKKSAEQIAKYYTKDLKFFTRDKIIALEGFPVLRICKGDRIFVGGGGVVLQCQPSGATGVKQALKITRPSLFASPESAVWDFEVSVKEYLTHAPLSHQNIVRVYVGHYARIVESGPKKEAYKSVTYACPAMLMEWLNEPVSFIDYLCHKAVDHLHVTSLIIQALEGLGYLHQKGLVHWDVKSDNILVDAAGIVRIADFGNSRKRSLTTPDAPPLEKAQSTLKNLPPALKNQIVPGGDPDRVSILNVSSKWNQPWLDLWMFGLDLNRVFSNEKSGQTDPSTVAIFLQRCFPSNNEPAQFSLSFLKLILQRLVTPQSVDDERFYTSANQIINDLKKLEPEFGAAQTVTELLATPQRVLRLPCWGNAPFSARVDKLFNCPLIRRLGKHLQLANLVHVYPGASHCRSEHVAGVMLCVIKYVQALFSDRSNPFWRISIDAKDVNALIVAALVHDGGHVAFGHFLEELSTVFRHRTHEDYIIHVLDANRPSGFGETVTRTIENDRHELSKVIDGFWCGDGESEEFMRYVGQIIKPSGDNDEEVTAEPDAILTPRGAKILKVQVLHSIMDGALDADKMDYLVRDSHHCGVKYGLGIDTDRFLQSLTTVVSWPADRKLGDKLGIKPRACIAISYKGILPVESLLLARYQMFTAVYWQHTARSETAMLQFLVCEYITATNSANEKEAQKRLDDIIHNFRINSDLEALDWLRRQIAKDRNLSDIIRSTMLEVVNTLLTRDAGIYWKIYEREYGTDKDADRYNLLLKLLVENGLKKAEEGVLAVSMWTKSLRALFAAAVKGEVDKIMLESGRSVSILIEPHLLLVDTAPIGKDDASNIFVTDSLGPRPFEEVSAIASAIRKTFGYWGRKLRVFVAPSLVQALDNEGVSAAVLGQACHAAIRNVFNQVSQLTLEKEFAASPRKKSSRKRGSVSMSPK